MNPSSRLMCSVQGNYSIEVCLDWYVCAGTRVPASEVGRHLKEGRGPPHLKKEQ